MDDPSRLEPDTLDELLEWLLASNPDAVLAALTPEATLCDLPEGFEAGGRQVLQGTSPMDFVPPESLGAVIEAWQQVREVGAAQTILASGEDPSEKVVLYLIDVTHRYGVYLAFNVLESGGEIPARPVEPVRETTRMARIRKDSVSTIVGVDADATALLGFEPDEIVGRRSLDLIHPDDHDRAIDCWMAMLTDPSGMRSVRLRHRRADGTYLWVDIANRNLLDAPEQCVVADVVDVSEQMAAQEQLRAREQLLARLTEALPLGVLQLDTQRRVVFANRRFFEFVGSDETEDPELDVDRVLCGLVDADRDLLGEALDGVLGEGTNQEVRIRMHRPRDPATRLLELVLRALTDEDGLVTGAVASVEDVTEQVQLQIELENRATQDALTGVFNRASTLSTLDELLRSDLHAQSGTALIYFDLDDLKAINDRLGHVMGDEMLRVVAERAEAVVRGGDIIGRVGGDEFLIVCPGLCDEHAAMEIAYRMRDEVNQPLEWGATHIEVRISIGVVWCDGVDIEAERLVAEADQMMYQSKRDGHGMPAGRRARGRSAPAVDGPERVDADR